jgi:hypothetical protein
VTLDLVGGPALEARLDNAPSNINKALAAGMVRVGVGLLAYLKTDLLSGEALGVRTGTGRRSTFYRVDGDSSNVTVYVGSDLGQAKYMRAQDRGASIAARNADSLAIPIGGAVTASKGVARFRAQDVISSPGSFGFVGTFTRHGIIFGTKGKKEKPVPLFILAKHVVLRAVGFMSRTLNDKRGWAVETVRAAVGGSF